MNHVLCRSSNSLPRFDTLERSCSSDMVKCLCGLFECRRDNAVLAACCGGSYVVWVWVCVWVHGGYMPEEA